MAEPTATAQHSLAFAGRHGTTATRAPGQLLFEVDKKSDASDAKGPLLSCVHGTACGRKAKAFVASSSSVRTPHMYGYSRE